MQNAKRLRAFKAWYDSTDSGKVLRVAALSLQLTQHPTAITGQTSNRGAKELPPLVRLGKQEAQSKTSQTFKRVLSQLGKSHALIKKLL